MIKQYYKMFRLKKCEQNKYTQKWHKFEDYYPELFNKGRRCKICGEAFSLNSNTKVWFNLRQSGFIQSKEGKKAIKREMKKIDKERIKNGK